MATVWFIGDIHAGHKNVCKFRTQFTSEEEHYEFVKENYHKVVTKRDKVFFMGDIAFTKERLDDISKWTAEQKVLIVGNHCLDSLTMKDIVNAYDSVYGLLKWKEFWLSHCPLHPNELRGKKNIHGHVHFQSIPDSRYFNTSLENVNYTPINVEDIRKRLSEAGMQELAEISQEMKLYD